MSLIQRRSPVNQEERRRLILEAATDFFFDNGLQNSSINELAAHLNVAKTIIYRVFPSRYALEEAIFSPIVEMVERNRRRPFRGVGSHIFPLLETMRTRRRAALLILRDCRTSPDHVHWFETIHAAFVQGLLIVFEPSPDAPPGGDERAKKAAHTMANFYVDTLSGWLEDQDGLTDAERARWFGDVVIAWRESARAAYHLGEMEFVFRSED